MAISSFLTEDRVSMSAAVWAVISVLLAVIFGVVGGVLVAYAQLLAGTTFGLLAVVLGIVAGVLQLIVLYQWSKVINQNINHTKAVFSHIKDRLEDPLRGEIGFFLNRLEEFLVPTWPFWGYLLFFIISIFTGWFYFLFGLVGFIFLAIYLGSIFRSTNKVSDLKEKLYDYLEQRGTVKLERRVFRIPGRSLFLFIVLSLITFTIYWLYLLVKLTGEINQYVSQDEQVRVEIEQAFAQTFPQS
ncbi:MAG: hypothetical protein PWP04_1329 [Candidatus Atribacteria bacterium]|nr:hypothetical protein [Candidatus Atribacteria bacterium]